MGTVIALALGISLRERDQIPLTQVCSRVAFHMTGCRSYASNPPAQVLEELALFHEDRELLETIELGSERIIDALQITKVSFSVTNDAEFAIRCQQLFQDGWTSDKPLPR